jgi:hypothetical protein
MDDIRYKEFLIGSPGVWCRGTLAELVEGLPKVDAILVLQSRFPTIDELNTLLALGKDSAGMSGGREWKPFTITQEQYNELLLEFATRPGSKIKVE